MSSTTLYLSYCGLFLLCLSSRSSSGPLYSFCRGSNVTSRYRANLNSVLSSLLDNSSQANGFYNSTAGLGTSDKVYGLFQCRGDLGSDACYNCVATAHKELPSLCSYQKTGIAWYDACFLRYSDQSDYFMGDRSICACLCDPLDVTEVDAFNQTLGKMMDEIAFEAANVHSGKKFAVQQRNYSSSGKLFALSQCIPDLSSDACDACLREAISRITSCCDNKQGGRFLLPSCYVQFENFPFYNIESPAPVPARNVAPSSPPPPPPSSSVPARNVAPSSPPPPPPPSSLVPARNVAPSPPPPPSSPVPARSVAPSPPHPRPPPPSPPASSSSSPTSIKGKSRISVPVVIAIMSSTVALFVVAFCFLKSRSRKKCNAIAEAIDGNELLTAEWWKYNLSQIQAATNNFAYDHKIGEGGFGTVYKGYFANGQEVAVKRLSRTSGQGAKEFKNELVLLTKLRHKNVVCMLGFCLEGEEKILIYEFVPNKSLDHFLSDPEKQSILDWSTRQRIIGGIARGLYYLHEDSPLKKIIHRDLKASNVLLDADMNPKIADFGLARIFGADQSEENASKIAGTCGYMAPEYLRDRRFSGKTDVFSFGVLILEIITGKKNSRFCQSEDDEHLLSYAWKNWRNGTPLAISDPALGDSYARNEVIRYIHVGLLCVQEDVKLRPPIVEVDLMLKSHAVELKPPHLPAFFLSSETQSMPVQPVSIDDASITEAYPR